MKQLTKSAYEQAVTYIQQNARPLDKALYAFGSEIESNSVEVHVSRLRKKLGRDTIQTLRGVGYRLGPP